LDETVFQLSAADFSKIAIAYEPIWAIGTGVTASSQQAQEMLAFLRGLIAEKFGKAVADGTSILYGGSCNAANAQELFSQPDIDGGLIGGASLKADDFLAIVNAY
jgi:triosephosphate isomerase